MKTSRTWMTALVLAALLLPGAGLQATGSGATSRSGPDNHASSGSGVVEARDARQGTVIISGEVYSVVPATRIVNVSGEPISLAELPVARVFRDEPRVDTDALVSFEATETTRGWVLEHVRVQGTLPQ